MLSTVKPLLLPYVSSSVRAFTFRVTDPTSTGVLTFAMGGFADADTDLQYAITSTGVTAVGGWSGDPSAVSTSSPFPIGVSQTVSARIDYGAGTYVVRRNGSAFGMGNLSPTGLRNSHLAIATGEPNIVVESVEVEAVPEPSTGVLLLLGVGALQAFRRRRRC